MSDDVIKVEGDTCRCGRWVLVMEIHREDLGRPFRCDCGRRWSWIKPGEARLIPHRVMPALCLDLDGTVRGSKSGARFGPTSPEDVELLPNVSARVALARDKGFYVVGVSNQGVVAYGSKTEIEVEAIALATRHAFPLGDPFHDLFMAYGMGEDMGGKVAPHNVRSLLRKPNHGMLVLAEMRARNGGILIDWDRSIMVGDRPEDEGCARAAGVTFQWAWQFFGWPEPTRGDP